MSVTKINTDGVITAGDAAGSAKSKVSAAKNGVADVRRRLDGAVKARRNIDARLASLEKLLGSAEEQIAGVRAVADSGANHYRTADDNLKKKF
ncbi:MAG: hypothetical protein LBS90_01335 [Oscillospiraceae bacterium]|jgi:chromosome segregation ATPase|nr:hypothetical protein [Oscillospiraceae bacterium]